MPRSTMRIDHPVPITSPEMFSSPYRDIPIDKDDPRGLEPLIPLESVGVAFESYYAKTDGKNPPFGRSIDGARPDIWLRKSLAEKLARVNQRLQPFHLLAPVLDVRFNPGAIRLGAANRCRLLVRLDLDERRTKRDPVAGLDEDLRHDAFDFGLNRRRSQRSDRGDETGCLLDRLLRERNGGDTHRRRRTGAGRRTAAARARRGQDHQGSQENCERGS